MNFDICKKCLRYSLKNKIAGGAIYNYDDESTTIGFYLLRRKYREIKVKLKTNKIVQALLFANTDRFNKKCFMKLDLPEALKDVEIVWCSEASIDKYNWWIEQKQCPYYMEHLMSEWNKEEK